ncbi:MAG: helix-turn-helix domain-containing protein [Acidithiobacillus sp.]
MTSKADPEPMSLGDCVELVVQQYLADLQGETPSNMHRLVMEAVERALLDTVLQHCEGQRGVAAQWLGINRNTLRKKLQSYGLET